MGSEANADQWRNCIWKMMQNLPRICRDAEALAAMDEQIGKWMADGMTPDLADLIDLTRQTLDALGKNSGKSSTKEN